MLELLETFCAVAEAGSLTKATEHLHRTQPAITRQLRALERALGAVLFTRTPQGVLLTPLGKEVLPHARAAVAAVRACRQVAAQRETGPGRRLAIAAGMMAMQYVLPAVVSRFRVLHPDVEIDLQPAHYRVALDRLLGYEVDAALIASPVRNPLVRATPILEDPLLLVGPPAGSPGGAPPGEPVRLTALSGQTLLVLPAGTGLHEQLTAVLQRSGVTCRLVEFPTAETIKTAVALGVGLTILPASSVEEEIQSGALIAQPIADWPEATRVIHLLMRADGRPPQPLADFAALLREHYAVGRQG